MKGRLLAIDPATLKCGLAVYDFSDSGVKLIAADRIHLKGELVERLTSLRTVVEDLIDRYEPTHVAVEDIKFSKFAPNFSALTKVAFAIGNILTVYGEAGYPHIGMFTANSVRKQWAVKQTKAALRTAVIKKFQTELVDLGYPDGLKKAHEDISDAIGLGLTCVSEIKRDLINGKERRN